MAEAIVSHGETLWFGACYVPSEGVWKWDDGTVVEAAHSNWGQGEPNIANGHHICVDPTTGKWFSCLGPEEGGGNLNYFGVCEGQPFYIADTNNHRIMKWHVGASQGELVAGSSQATSGSGTGSLNKPTAVDIDVDGKTLIIADSGNKRIMKWTQGAAAGTIVGASDSLMSSLGSKLHVQGDGSGNYLISDGENCRVIKWLPSGSGGESKQVAGHQNACGCTDDKIGGDVALGSGDLGEVAVATRDAPVADHLYIADPNCNRIVKWFPQATTGENVGASSTGSSAIKGAYGVKLEGNVHDKDGNTQYVADTGNHRVAVDAFTGQLYYYYTYPTTATGPSTACTTDLEKLNTPRSTYRRNYKIPSQPAPSNSGNGRVHHFVADTGCHRAMLVQQHDTDQMKFIAGTGVAGSGLDQLSSPHDIHVGKPDRTFDSFLS
jgi:hypothetical protein